MECQHTSTWPLQEDHAGRPRPLKIITHTNQHTLLAQKSQRTRTRNPAPIDKTNHIRTQYPGSCDVWRVLLFLPPPAACVSKYQRTGRRARSVPRKLGVQPTAGTHTHTTLNTLSLNRLKLSTLFPSFNSPAGIGTLEQLGFGPHLDTTSVCASTTSPPCKHPLQDPPARVAMLSGVHW